MCNRCIASSAPPDAQRLSRLRRFSLLARHKPGVGRFCPADAQLISYRKPCAGRACKLSLPVRPGSAWFCPADAQRFSRLRRFPFLARGKSGVGSFCPADAQRLSRLRRFPLLARGKSGVGRFCPADAQRLSRLRRFPLLARRKPGVGSFCPADAQLISCRRPCAGRASKLSLGALTEKKQMVYNNVYDSSDFERMQRKLWELQGK